MVTTLTFQGRELRFPPRCASCLAERPEGSWRVFKTIFRGDKSYTLSYDVPLCGDCTAKAQAKSLPERVVGWGGLLLGPLAALGLRLLLPSPPGTLALIVIGLTFGLLGAVVSTLFVAPLLAPAETKRIRNAVQIVGWIAYDPSSKDPASHTVSLKLANSEYAALLKEANADRLLPEGP